MPDARIINREYLSIVQCVQKTPLSNYTAFPRPNHRCSPRLNLLLGTEYADIWAQPHQGLSTFRRAYTCVLIVRSASIPVPPRPMRTVAVFFTWSACCVADTMPPPALRSSFEYTAMEYIILYNYCIESLCITVFWAESVCDHREAQICASHPAHGNQSGY